MNNNSHDEYSIVQFKKGIPWKYVLVKQGTPPNTTNPFWKCSCCKNIHIGGGTRIVGHFLGIAGRGIKKCDMPSEEIILDLEKYKETTSKKEPTFYAQEYIKEVSKDSTEKNIVADTEKDLKDILKKDKEEVDRHVARFIYAMDLPFNTVRSSYFTHMIESIAKYAINHTETADKYYTPNETDIGDSLLKNEVTALQSYLKEKDNVRKYIKERKNDMDEESARRKRYHRMEPEKMEDIVFVSSSLKVMDNKKIKHLEHFS